MKFTCHSADLQKGLNAVSKAVPLKNTLPILANVLVSASDGKVKISATNLETAITVTIPSSIEVEGSYTVPAKLFREAVSHTTSEKVQVELKNDYLHLNSEKSITKFNGIPSEDFPPLPDLKDSQEALNLNPTDFSSAIGLVGFAASVDETRPMYSGILMDYSGGVLTFASTDGFRLSEKITNVPADVDAFKAVIPAKTLLEVSRLLSSSSEPIRFYLSEKENRALFASAGTLVATGIFDGNFPDYRRIIPSDNKVRAEFLAKDLQEAVRLASIFAQDDDAALKLVFDPKGHVHVTSISQETGENVSRIAAKVESENELELEVAFNPKYLLDLLNNVKVEALILETRDNVSPCLLTSSSEKDYLHIIMPLRINS